MPATLFSRRSPCTRSPRFAAVLTSTLLAVAIVAVAPLAAAPPPPAGQVETLILYDPAAPETPESIVFDRDDNAYVTLAFTGEVVKIAPDFSQSVLATLPIGAPCGPVPTVALGLAIDRQDRLFVAVSACDPSNQGVWEIDVQTGAIALVANVPSATVLNGIDFDEGGQEVLYAADTFDGRLWRIPKDGGIAEIWSTDPLLARPPGAIFPGPNGVRVFRGEVYVANSSTGDIVAVPIEPDGSAGPARVHAAGLPCDEFVFDVEASLYCTTDPFNTVVRVDPDGTQEVILDASDLLDGPTSVAFGRRGTNRKNLYVTNAAFPIFTTTFRPSLMRVRLEVAGAP